MSDQLPADLSRLPDSVLKTWLESTLFAPLLKNRLEDELSARTWARIRFGAVPAWTETIFRGWWDRPGPTWHDVAERRERKPLPLLDPPTEEDLAAMEREDAELRELRIWDRFDTPPEGL